MGKVKYRIWYRIEDMGNYVQVKLMIEDSFGEIIVSQDEGRYEDMQDAKYLIEYLTKIGAEIEYAKAESYKA